MNDIVKALQCCASLGVVGCKECPRYSGHDEVAGLCSVKLKSDAAAELTALREANKALESDKYNAELNLQLLTAELTALREAIKIKGGTEHYPTEDAYLAACAALEKLHRESDALREATRWIPVAEKLPEDCAELNFYDDGRLRFTSVLAVSGKEVRMRNRLIVRESGNSYLDEQVTSGWMWGAGESVTHWMPLPSAPKEET